MPQPVEPPSPGGLASPSTPQAAESARRAAAACAAASLQRLQQQYQEQLSLQQQAASAAAAAASASLASGQDPSQSYTAQYSAAAAHAAQALALQRQLQLQQALLSSCGYPVANTTGPSGGGPQGSFSCDLLSSYGASQAAAIAAVYGQQAQHSRQAMSGPAEPASPDASAGATPVPTSPGAPGPGSPWAAGTMLGAGWTGGLSPATQPATPPVQRRSMGPPTLQDKIEEWERQNALMAAFTAGSPCPDLAAASLAQHGLPWALPTGGCAAVPQAVPGYPMLPATFSAAYQQPQQPLQPRSLQVTLSTAPKVRLSTAGGTEGKPNPTTSSSGGGAAAPAGAAAAAAGGSGPSSTSVSAGTGPSEAQPASLDAAPSHGAALSPAPEAVTGMEVAVEAE
ncbi:hypothetical protein ABPG77_004508 [Micractinium sp. CCAP 211/92]